MTPSDRDDSGKEETLTAELLPESEWTTCSRCRGKIPKFELSAEFNSELLEFLAQGRNVRVVYLLSEKSGCDIATAKAWVAHHRLEHFASLVDPSLPEVWQAAAYTQSQAMPVLPPRLALSPQFSAGICRKLSFQSEHENGRIESAVTSLRQHEKWTPYVAPPAAPLRSSPHRAKRALGTPGLRQ